MPRPILRTPSKTETQNQQKMHLNLTTKPNQSQQQMSQIQIDRLLRKPRSKEYMEAIHSLDNGGHVHNQHKVNEIIDILRKEFPDVEIRGVFLGVVSKCYLGQPYEVHSLDMTGQIIEHYQLGQTMPGGLEKARNLALCGSYEFVEVYIDCCRAVSASGTVSVVKN